MAHYLGRLPEDERALLRMRFYEELSQTEIADRDRRSRSGRSRRGWSAACAACAS